VNEEVRIFRYLYKKKDASTAYKIAKDLKIPTSSSRYFLEKMVDKGIVVKIKNKKVLYGLHPLFFDSNFWDKCIGKLKDTMKIFTEFNYEEFKIDFDVAYTLKLLIEFLAR